MSCCWLLAAAGCWLLAAAAKQSRKLFRSLIAVPLCFPAQQVR